MLDVRHGYPKNPRTIPPAGAPGTATRSPGAWTIELIDAPGAWLLPASAAQTVCVIDAGFNFAHQDLVGAVVDQPAVIEIDTSAPAGKEWHGTQVAAVIAGVHDNDAGAAGVCPGAHILPIQVGGTPFKPDVSLEPYGIAVDTMADRIREAIRIINDTFASTEHRVLNISMSGTFGPEMAQALARKYLLAEVDAFLGRGGVLVVGGSNLQTPAAECFPAAIKQVSTRAASILVVSACDRPPAEGFWDGGVDAFYKGQDDVDLYAPGGFQDVADGATTTRYVSTSGNSLAIPHAAGVAAHLFRINPALDGERVAAVIRDTAEIQTATYGGEPVRVLNAFAAALKVYNEAHDTGARAGYRVIVPIAFNEGTLEVNGCHVGVVSTAQVNHAFCRFTAPKDADITARLFKNTTLEPDGSRRCYWEGRFQDLLEFAMTGSRRSAWSHPVVEELHTVRLQGLALTICRGGPGCDPVPDAQVSLTDRRRRGRWSARMDPRGRFLLPFGEPGPYTLTVIDGTDRHEIDLDLATDTIYTEDPNHPGSSCIVLGAPVPGNRWLNNWAGSVFRDGSARLEDGTLKGARGTMHFKAVGKTLTREIFLHHCYEALTGDQDSFAEAIARINEECTEPTTPEAFADTLADMMPALGKPTEIRVFSLLHGDLANGFFTGWQQQLETEVWHDGETIPPGALIAQIAGNGVVTIDLGQLTPQVLKAYFRDGCEGSGPYTVKLEFGFFVDHSRWEGAGTRFFLTKLAGEMTVAEVPCLIERYLTDDRRRARIVAGPCSSALRFEKHPDSQLQIDPDSGPAPAGCISAIVTAPPYREDVPGLMWCVYAVGSLGEIGRVIVA